LAQRRWGLDAVAAQALPPGGDRRLEGRDASPALGLAGDHVPGRALGVAAGEHLPHRPLRERPEGAGAPGVGRELPGLERVGLALLEALELLALGDVQPALDEDHALLPQRALERVDLLVGAAPVLLRRQLLDALDQHPAVPGAVEHGHATPA